MKQIWIISMMALGLAFTSCSEEDEKLTPSGIEDGYIIAKGDADYDKTINEFYQKYSSCLLYNWTEKDAYWTPGGWQNGVLGKQDDGGKSGYLVYAPEKEYISKQLHLLDRLWFRFYSDKALQKLLPYKILLCSNVQETETSWIFEPEFAMVYEGKDVSAHYNYDNIAVSFASNRVENLTVSDSARICQELNQAFLNSMIGRGIVSTPKKFIEGIDYTAAQKLNTTSEFIAKGIFKDTKTWAYPSSDYDWKTYLNMMFSYPESFLTREPQSVMSDYDFESDSFYDGILNPAKDTNGMVKKRYDIVRQYFIDNFDADLQAVGNAVANWK